MRVMVSGHDEGTVELHNVNRDEIDAKVPGLEWVDLAPLHTAWSCLTVGKMEIVFYSKREAGE